MEITTNILYHSVARAICQWQCRVDVLSITLYLKKAHEKITDYSEKQTVFIVTMNERPCLDREITQMSNVRYHNVIPTT